MLSYAWRGPRGCGKRTRLLNFLQNQCKSKILKVVPGFWVMNKNGSGNGIIGKTLPLENLHGVAGGDDSITSPNIIGSTGDDEEETGGKIIPYESSSIHLGFDVARMSMSDKGIIQSILMCWTGQHDVTLFTSGLTSRYLVLYHAHLLTDESILQIQECLEKFNNFAVLMTTEMPLCSRICDHFLEIPCSGEDKLLKEFIEKESIVFGNEAFKGDIWKEFFRLTAEQWSKMDSFDSISHVRNWIYICLQRNLRWTDVVQYWIETVWELPWIRRESKAEVFEYLSHCESGGGWNLIPSYRIPILWERNHLELANMFRKIRERETDSSNS